MKLFRVRRKPKSGEENKELVLDTDAETQAPTLDRTEPEPEPEASADTPAPDAAAEAEAPAHGEAPAPEGDLLTQIGAEADSEIEAEEKASEEDDPLDPDLVDIFREAKNEVEESTLASELEDIPAQDLLSDLVGVSRSLSRTLRARAESGQDRK
jgi:hypothetical protein